MEKDLNTVVPKVRLDGEEVMFESVTLDQEINSCHRFEVVLAYMSQSDLWKGAENYRAKVGSSILIRLEHRDSGESYEFSGIVTDVSVEALNGDTQLPNRIRLVGGGDVVSLDGTVGRESFVDCQLYEVVRRLTERSRFTVECNPKCQEVLPFLMRYDESKFAFLSRLSALFGEWFFYDGKRLHFGEPTDRLVETLLFDIDLLGLRTVARAQPKRPSSYDYYLEEDKSLSVEASPRIPDSLKEVAKKSDLLFREDGATVSGVGFATPSALSDWVDRSQQSAMSRMHNVVGESKTCKVKLGSLVEIAFPKAMGVSSLGRFRIVSLRHRIDKSGNYRNRFEAVPEGLSAPMSHISPSSRAYPELAVVADNADPKCLGRVKVQFDWQRPIWQSTNWLRVVTPNGGSCGAVPKNRGVLFIPEVGDQVMVGFEHGDPNRPYVVGSLFSGSAAAGGGDENTVKSISTRSGHRIDFNDDHGGEWGITISDSNGNSINLSSSQKTIVISSQENIVLQSKNIQLEAEENISHKSGKNLEIEVGCDYRLDVEKDCTSAVRGNKNEAVDGNHKRWDKGDSELIIDGNATFSVSKKLKSKVESDSNLNFGGALNCESSGESNLKSQSKVQIVGKKDVYIGN